MCVYLCPCMCVYMCPSCACTCFPAFVCACVLACVRICVLTCVCACVIVCVCACVIACVTQCHTVCASACKVCIVNVHVYVPVTVTACAIMELMAIYHILQRFTHHKEYIWGMTNYITSCFNALNPTVTLSSPLV